MKDSISQRAKRKSHVIKLLTEADRLISEGKFYLAQHYIKKAKTLSLKKEGLSR